MEPKIIRKPITKEELQKATEAFGGMVKVVVDIERNILALDGEMHFDGEQLLLENGSLQQHLWGANIYSNHPRNIQIEYTSLINIRPAQNNRSMEIQDQKLREQVEKVIRLLLPLS